MEINFKGALSKDEYLKAHKLHNPHKKLRPLLTFLIPLMIIVGVINFSKNQGISFFVLLVILFWTVGLLYVKYRIRKYWNQSKVIKERCSGVVSDKEITITSETWNANLTWDCFIKYKLSPELVLLYRAFKVSTRFPYSFFMKCILTPDRLPLYQAAKVINIYPRSFFENENDWESFIEIVKNNVTSK